MRLASLSKGLLPLLAAAALLAPAAAAQLCPDAGDTFWKNDVMPDAPVGVPAGAHVAIAMCPTEAAGSYFQLAPGSKPQLLKQVSVGFGHTGGETNHPARVNIEIYEGTVAFNPGGTIPSIGTKIFDLVADEGLEMVVMTNGMNSYDLTPFNIIVDANFVVAFRMIQNVDFPGCPGANPGLPANFLTDSSASCTSGLNLFDEKFVGWMDPANWQFQLGSPICPQFFAGNFLIRACTEDAGTWTDLGFGLNGTFGKPLLTGSGPLTEGSLNPLSLSNTLPSTQTFVFIGFTQINVLFKGGILVPSPDLLLSGFHTNASGSWSVAAPWPGGVPTGFMIYWQAWIPDTAAPINVAASNAISSESP